MPLTCQLLLRSTNTIAVRKYIGALNNFFDVNNNSQK
jgi:hypothetical protein